MTAAKLIAQFNSLDIRLSVRDGNLQIDAPTGAVTPDLMSILREHKALLIEALSVAQCNVCGGSEFDDTPIHEGRSVRRDCRQCGRFHSWPVWYGNNSTTTSGIARFFNPGGMPCSTNPMV